VTEAAARYEGKVVLVTGSRRGIGLLIVEHFLAHGARVIGFARGESTVTHQNYVHVQVDIGDPVAVQRAFAELKKVTRVLHILVNNAAVITSQYAMILPAAAAQAMLATNVMGTFMVSREASKLMRKAKWGRIINIGSMAAKLEPIGDSMYAASKAALSSLANVMAKELAPLHITCNTVGVTAIHTDMLAQLSAAKIAEVVAALPIPRFAEPDDILNVIDFLASERSGYITAQSIYLGGVS
jgi:3-oxoacyl-[acyl-carrier protein] reductase